MTNKIHTKIPGGSHTYSKGDDQFPVTVPRYIDGAKGYRVWGDGRSFVDWTMGLASVSIGHANDEVISEAKKWLHLGSNFPRPSILEEQLADSLLKLSAKGSMVKFGKHGSDCTSSAIRLARAFTGRDHVVACSSNPFYSVHDWWIGKTEMNAGVPKTVGFLTHTFSFGDLAALDQILDQWGNEVACIIVEPGATTSHFQKTSCRRCGGKGSNCAQELFWRAVANKARSVGALFILDENKTGFRMALPGAHAFYGLDADMICYGKAIANGFSVSALVGKSEILDQGGIYQKELNKVFLLSATHGGETHSLAAALKTIEIMNRDKVSEHMWRIGSTLTEGFNRLVNSVGLGHLFALKGYGCFPVLEVLPGCGDVLALRTLFLQEMAREGVIFNFISPSLAHDQEAIDITLIAAQRALAVCSRAIDDGTIESLIEGPILRPVFRRRN